MLGIIHRRVISTTLTTLSLESATKQENNCGMSIKRTLVSDDCAKSALPDFTKNRYPNVKRGNFASLDHKHIQFFRELLGENRVINDPTDCESYNVDWIKSVRGFSQCVLKPKTTEEVSKILSFCNDHNLAVCPQGGNTGLVGGSVPVFDEIVLSTSLMNNIIDIDDTSGVLVCQAGCVLENLEQKLEGFGLIMPLDLGAKGSCQIGGNVSTNAGGLRLLRYGNLHGTVVGLEVVKANGEVLDLLSTLRKDNTGFHLKNLFIGSEGTLGIITQVAIVCPPKPKSNIVAFLGLESFEKVLAALKKSKQSLGEILSSCELIDAKSLDLVTSYLKLKNPIGEYPFYMIIEAAGSESKHDEEKVNSFLNIVMSDGTVLDGTVTSEPSKIRAIWELRENITSALLFDGYVFKYDISLPIQHFYSLVPAMLERMGKDAVRVCGYGHVGDGNIHLNITVKKYTEEIMKKIQPFIYEYTSKLKGSISAEHGIGFMKTNYIKYSKSPESIQLMKDLKQLMDPKGILNPYKVIA